MTRHQAEPASTAMPNIRVVAVERLLLDVENPRLASSAATATQAEVLKVLWTEMAVDELVLSIAANGFFQEEPLFVIPERHGDDPDNLRTKLIVVEGNRRLAAVQILLYDDVRQRVRATDMPVIDEAAKQKLKELPVSIYKTRKELWAFLSFRHINSPKPWDAFSKAKYVAHVHDGYGIPLDEISAKIGDRHSTVTRLYNGYKVLQQAELQASFDVDDRVRNRFYFSHLYTALDYPEYRAFLGILADGPLQTNPVPEPYLDNLKELMIWLYGKKSENIAPVVQRQAPDLNKLRDVLGNPSALSALRKGYALDVSHDISIGDERRFRQALTSAKEELQQAKAAVTTGYFGASDLFNTMEDIQDIAKTVRSEMKPKYARASQRK